MLQDIRDNSQGTIAKVIIGLICTTFALVGVESLLGSSSQTKVAEVNGQVISVQELQDAVRLRQRSLMAQMGDRVDPQMLDANKLAPQVLQSLVNRSVTLQQASELGIEVSTQQMELSIAENPQFHQDGKFSQDLFNMFTQSLSISPASFRDIYHSELVVSQLSSGIIKSSFLTDATIDVDALFTHQTRDVRFIELKYMDALASVTVADQEIEDHYNTNQSNFLASEKVQIEYIELKQADFIKPATDAEIKAAYNAEIAALSQEPTVQVAHILIDPAAHDGQIEVDTLVTTVQEKLAAGESFESLAEVYSDDFGSKQLGGQLGTLSADIFPLEFYDAAIQLGVNQVSDPVLTDNGIHLIKVTGIQQAEVPSFKSRQAAIGIAISEANASPAFWTAVEELKDISFNAADLSEPAEMLDVKVQTSELFDRTTNNELLSNPILLSQAFNAELVSDRVNSELIELSSDHAIVLRVIEHKPEVIKPFASVKTEAKDALLSIKAKALLDEQSESITAELLAGESVESVAKAFGLEWQAELAVKRNQNKLPMAVAQAAFSVGSIAAEQSIVDKVSLSTGNSAIFLVSNVQDGSAVSMQAAEKTMMQTYLAQNKGALEFQALTAAAKDSADIELVAR